MLNIKNIKKSVVRVVCMIMLVLIQFDVCGYDLLRALQLADSPVPNYVNDSESSFIDDEQISEWSNPVYRGVHTRTLIKAPLMEFFLSLFVFNEQELPLLTNFAHSFQAKLSNLTYLRFCVFLI